MSSDTISVDSYLKKLHKCVSKIKKKKYEYKETLATLDSIFFPLNHAIDEMIKIWKYDENVKALTDYLFKRERIVHHNQQDAELMGRYFTDSWVIPEHVRTELISKPDMDNVVNMDNVNMVFKFVYNKLMAILVDKKDDPQIMTDNECADDEDGGAFLRYEDGGAFLRYEDGGAFLRY